MTKLLGFASYQDGRFELIVQDCDTGEETQLEGTLKPGQFGVADRVLPTCVFVLDVKCPSLTLPRQDWRLVRRAVGHYGHHLVRRAARPSALPGGADQRELDRVRALAAPLAEVAGEGGGFV